MDFHFLAQVSTDTPFVSPLSFVYQRFAFFGVSGNMSGNFILLVKYSMKDHSEQWKFPLIRAFWGMIERFESRVDVFAFSYFRLL